MKSPVHEINERLYWTLKFVWTEESAILKGRSIEVVQITNRADWPRVDRFDSVFEGSV